MKGYKRCKCRGQDKRELGASCPRLRRRDGSWNPAHGTWYGKSELPPGKDGKRVTLRQGGFATQDDLDKWFGEALQLLAVPEAGPDGHDARLEILSLIRESRHRKAALPGYDDIRRRYQEGAAFRPGSTGDYLLAWLKLNGEAESWSSTTLLSYTSAVTRLFLPSFGEVPLDRLRSAHVAAMLTGVDAENERILAARASEDPDVRASVAGRRPASLATKKRHLAVLRSALNDAIAARLIVGRNAAEMRIGKAGKGKKKGTRTRAKLWTAERERAWREDYAARVATGAASKSAARRFALWRSTAARPGPVMLWKPAHLGRFLDAAEEDRLYPLYCLIAYCALRRGEAVGIRWADIDLDARAASIINQIIQVGWKAEQSEPKSDASFAFVRIDDVSIGALEAWHRVQDAERKEWATAWAGTGLVFTREDGSAYHPAYVTSRFERIAFAAGLPPVRLHDLRHGAATLALAAGADIKAVSSLLRHSSIQITADIYADVLPELAAEVSSKVVLMVPRRGVRPGASKTRGLPTVSQGVSGPAHFRAV